MLETGHAVVDTSEYTSTCNKIFPPSFIKMEGVLCWQQTKISNYHEQSIPFLAYSFKIARNKLVDFYRREGRSGGLMSIEENPFTDTRSDPACAAVIHLEHQEVRQTLEQLREDYRMVLILRFLSGLSPEETGEVMGRTPGAVRILQHRALLALRNLLDM